MISGHSMWHIMENFIRIELDTWGHENVTMHYDENQTWVLYRHGNLVGKAKYDLENVIIEIKP